jgi:hypothetical protein
MDTFDQYICPRCAANLRGEATPRAGGGSQAPTHYSRVIGVVVSEVYDGVLLWMCPECGGKWHRWPEGTDRHAAAERYMQTG